MRALELDVMPDVLSVCRLPSAVDVSELVAGPGFVAVMRAGDELSAVVRADRVRPEWFCSAGWRHLRVRGPLKLTLTGVLASLLVPLADAGISVFPMASYETDHVLVPGADLEAAVQALTAAGHTVHRA